ncbi:hypothetical protein [Streptomyces halobius]|uniref:Uncharacterized protein n=1 Tax=Streptomyces halobius TaxID=2879846 RepID=A0ABY4M371_9ACTN|nr:hypothetical protein [Streptomyces halobius]UQA90686.1 hypothetical protein K9S39_01175 [Streptomyces halobius]
MSLEDEVRLLEMLGPRLTGSVAHRALVEDVAAKLTGMGLAVRRDTRRFTRWEVPGDAGRVRLEVAGRELRVASAYPYSGTTGPAGISRPLRHLAGIRPDWKRARNAIAVIEVPHVAVCSDILFGSWGEGPDLPPLLHPVLSASLFGPSLKAARKAGVSGVIAVWKGMSAENARGQYVPFTLPDQNIPALWVAGDAGEHVVRAARSGAQATLVLDAELTPGCETDTIWAVAEGETRDETILVITHSDGTNAVEENGHIALLALAEVTVRRRPRRTVVFVMTTGHLRIPAMTGKGQATTAWMAAHPELWAGAPGQARAVAGLAMEHLGAREHRDDPHTGTCQDTGRLEPELLYATTRELREIVAAEWSGATPGAVQIAAPGPLIHFGEGEPLYDQGIPGVALVTSPQYLLAERTGDLVDLGAMHRQIDSFQRLLHRFDTLPPTGFGTIRKPSKARKAAAAIRVLKAVLTAKRRQ